MKIAWIGIVFCVFSLLSCRSNSSAPSKEVIAEVKGKYLYLSNLQSALPSGLSRKDSTEFAKHYINNWLADELMYDIAKKNIPDAERVDQMVEEYRQQLITTEYQRYLVEEKLENEISDQEIEAYYKENKAKLVMKKDQIKGLYLKIPINAPQRSQLRSLMLIKKTEDVGKLEKYAIQHAQAYENFVDKWTDFDAVIAKIPCAISNPSVFLRQNKQLEVKDSSSYYLLVIKKVALAGSPFPEDMAKEEIKKELASIRKVDYIDRFRNELLNKALKNSDAKINKVQ